jgi:PKD repeat protein
MLQAPEANFSATLKIGKAPLNVTFRDNSVSGSSPITAWEWDFNNDGKIDKTGRGPHTHTYSEAKNYSVKLTVFDGKLKNTKTNYIRVESQDEDPIVLPPPDPPYTPTPIIKQGEETAESGNYEAAIASYEKIPQPGPEDDPRDYVEAQHRLGVLYWQKLKEYRQAIQAFQNVLSIDARSYAAHYNLAAVYYETQQLARARSHCDQLLRLKHLIPVGESEQVEMDTRYLKALCQYRLYQNETEKNRKRQTGLICLSELEDFVSRISSNSSAFQDKKQDAEKKIAEIQAQMNN